MEAIATQSHWKTAGAIFVSLSLLVPAMMLTVILWRFSGMEIPEADYSNTWLPVVLAFPIRLFGVFMLGVCGAGLAFLGATGLVKGASIEATAYAVSSVLGTATLGLVALVVLQTHDLFGHLDTLAQGAGWVFGTFAAAYSR